MSLVIEIDDFLNRTDLAPATTTKYRRILTRWLDFLKPPPSPADLSPHHIENFLLTQADLSPATRRVCYSALLGFCRFLELRKKTALSTVRLGQLVKPLLAGRRSRLHDYTLPDIEAIITAAETATHAPFPNTPTGQRARLIAHRTFVLIVNLADTGLRISELLALRRGDLRWTEKPVRAAVVGKGNKERWTFFSPRAAAASHRYLELRQADDAATGRPLHTLPLLANHHSKQAGAGISTVLAWKTIRRVAERALPAERAAAIHPHVFRHYFLTRVWRETGDINLSKDLAGHANISTTSRYTHANAEDLAAGYGQVFDR